MRVDPWPFLQRYEFECEAVASGRWAFLRSDVDRTLIRRQVLASQPRQPVQLLDSLVLKSFPLSLSERLFGTRLDSFCGLQGGGGELLNTLLANRLGVPAHQLLAVYQQAWHGDLVLVFSRLQGCIPLVEALHDSPQREFLLWQTFALLHAALRCGCYHADANASNILCNETLQHFSLIDFECMLPLGCAPGLALALQASSLYDWRLRDLLPLSEYRQLLQQYLFEQVEGVDLKQALTAFDQYSTERPGREARRHRLQLAAGGNADVRRLFI